MTDPKAAQQVDDMWLRQEEKRQAKVDAEDMKRLLDPRADTSPELILALTLPTVDKTYSKFVSRDLAVGNLPTLEHVGLVRKYISLINDFLFLGLNNIANIYNADLKALLNAIRSYKGFERKQQTTLTMMKGGMSPPDQKKKRWGLS